MGHRSPTWADKAHARQIAGLDPDLDQAIRRRPVWRAQENLLRSVPGVGPIVARTLLAQLPELWTLSNQTIAALVGVAPLNPGQRPVPRAASGVGRPRCGAARAVYGALAAVRFNPVLRAFYERLRPAGTLPKVAPPPACTRSSQS